MRVPVGPDAQPFSNRRAPPPEIRWAALTGVFPQGKGSRAALEDLFTLTAQALEMDRANLQRLARRVGVISGKS